MDTKYKKLTEEILDIAGSKINGSHPWDIHIHNYEFYRRAITEGELGLGESYMDAWWEAEKIDEFVYRALTTQLDEKLLRKVSCLAELFIARIINRQSQQSVFIVGEKHYDLGNDLFRNMLDKRMNYSCAYWKDADNLEKAQEDKIELIFRSRRRYQLWHIVFSKNEVPGGHQSVR